MEDPELAEVLAGIVPLLQPERTEGPSVADLEEILESLKYAGSVGSETKRRKLLEDLESALKETIRFYKV